MDLSTTHLADQVRDALREGDSLKDQWLNTDGPVVVIDSDEHPADTAFNMDSIDRDLADLLNPHSTTEHIPPRTSSTPPPSPITPTFLASPASRLPRARQALSFLPRLRSSPSPQFQTPPPPASPKPSSPTVVHNSLQPSTSPALPSTSTSTPIPSRRSTTLNQTPRSFSSSTASLSKVLDKQNASTRILRQAMQGVQGPTRDSTSSPSPCRPTRITLGRSSLDSRCPTTDNTAVAIGLGRPMSRGASFDSRPAFNPPSTSPETTETTPAETEDSSPDIPFQEYRPSFDSNITTRPSFDGINISRPHSAAAPLRDQDGRRTPSLRVVDTAPPIPRILNPPARMRKRSMSVQERFGRGGNEDLARSGSSLSTYGTKTSGGSVNESGGPKMEWLGPRTAKAFRAAGLLDFDREKERDNRDESNESTTRLRDRSSSTSGVLSPSPLGVGNSASALNRFASIRSASEYNPVYARSHSRLTLSETGSGVPRRGSESFSTYGGTSSHGGNGGGGGSLYGHNGLMESPTFTGSSGRDTPKSSISTAPTSLADSFGYLGRENREREREREEMREMKERHGTEMGALLGALSDSQRMVRVLREENSDLRDRLERFTVAVQANHELRRVCVDLQSECSSLERENVDLRKGLVGLRHGTGSRTPVPKAAAANTTSSPLARTFTNSRVAHEEYDDTFIDHGSEVENHQHQRYLSKKESTDIILASSSPVSSKKRRLSDSSSIFPIPPSNMTLLLHDDVTSTLGSIASASDLSQYGFSSPPPSTSQRKTHVESLSSPSNFAGGSSGDNTISLPNSSVTSVGNISPSTANFSMVTGSPGSLFLKPEHEILLGDMESLDLGVRGGGGGDNVVESDGW